MKMDGMTEEKGSRAVGSTLRKGLSVSSSSNSEETFKTVVGISECLASICGMNKLRR